MNYEQAKDRLLGSTDLLDRMSVLQTATQINPDFKNPQIVGGYLRDTLLGNEPSDCDVFFEGYTKNQPDTLESVLQAQSLLELNHLKNWEFENILATGPSSDSAQDTIGLMSNHTDYLTLLSFGLNNLFQVGSPKTLDCISSRTYEIRYQGLMVWMGFRDRSYFRIMAGVSVRGVYLCARLNLNPTPEAVSHFMKSDYFWSKLTDQERLSLLNYWKHKTSHLPSASALARQYGITFLSN